MDLTGRVVVVTGSTGFLGGALIASLERAGATVRGIARRPRPGEQPVDVTDPGTIAAVLGAEHTADCVVHTAALQGDAAPRSRFEAVNVRGTENVLRAAAAAGARRFVHVSSIAVLGRRYPDGADEDTPVARTGDRYADTKAAAETLVRRLAATEGVEAVIVRPGDIWGPGSPRWVEAPLEQMRAGRFMWISGGRGNLDLVHIDDLTAGVLLAMTHPAAAGRTYLMTDGARGTTARAYFTRLAEAAGVALRARSVPAAAAVTIAALLSWGARLLGKTPPVSPAGLRAVDRSGWLSCARARHELGYAPRLTLDVGMPGIGERYAPPA